MFIIQVAGRLGRDPESRFTPSGQKLTTLNLATNVRKGGKDQTVWWRITIWGDRFDKMLPYLKKGSAIIVVGEMQPPEIYTDKEGRPQVSLDLTAEIIRFSPFGNPDKPNQEQGSQQSSSYSQPSQPSQSSPQSRQPFVGESSHGFENVPSGQFSHAPDDDEPIPF